MLVNGKKIIVLTVHLLYKLTECHIITGTNFLTSGCNTSQKQTRFSIFKTPKAKSGIPEHDNRK